MWIVHAPQARIAANMCSVGLNVPSGTELKSAPFRFPGNFLAVHRHFNTVDIFPPSTVRYIDLVRILTNSSAVPPAL